MVLCADLMRAGGGGQTAQRQQQTPHMPHSLFEADAYVAEEVIVSGDTAADRTCLSGRH
ncbi:hypothetical protein ABZ079_35170 [Streptomyces sp. NPDC006314]|uniref:hypothetical protein n=1 Tax=Streptomyces sp. NPDC006314 TaxID=3154475 RepID=UPI0033A7CC82